MLGSFFAQINHMLFATTPPRAQPLSIEKARTQTLVGTVFFCFFFFFISSRMCVRVCVKRTFGDISRRTLVLCRHLEKSTGQGIYSLGVPAEAPLCERVYIYSRQSAYLKEIAPFATFIIYLYLYSFYIIPLDIVKS